jgi:hypothetical protein
MLPPHTATSILNNERCRSEKSNKLSALISLIRKDTDESKLAGLMLIPKVVDVSDEQAMVQIYCAVGFSFIFRLLSSPGSPGNPSDEGCLYNVLALNVLSTFCMIGAIEAELTADSAFYSIAPIVLSSIRNIDIRTGAFDDILVILHTLAKVGPGRDALNVAQAPAVLATVTEDESLPVDTTTKIFLIYDAVLDLDRFPAEATNSVPMLAKIFSTSKSSIKFEAFSRLIGVLSSGYESTQTVLRESVDRSWHCSVRDALMELLRNRVRGHHRRNIFLCSLCMFDLYGPDWATKSSGTDSPEIYEKFVQLLMAFCNIELRMRLEGPLRPEDNIVVVPICIALLEHAVSSLTDESTNTWKNLSSDALLHLRTQFEESADGTTLSSLLLHGGRLSCARSRAELRRGPRRRPVAPVLRRGRTPAARGGGGGPAGGAVPVSGPVVR